MFHGGAVLIFSLLFPWKDGWRALECMHAGVVVVVVVGDDVCL